MRVTSTLLSLPSGATVSMVVAAALVDGSFEF